jgi:hypothetical protein
MFQNEGLMMLKSWKDKNLRSPMMVFAGNTVVIDGTGIQSGTMPEKQP